MLDRIRKWISCRVHDRRLQNRLQFGSALALGVGLVISASIFFGLFDLARPLLISLLHSPDVAALNNSLVAENRLMQLLIIFLVALLAGATLPHVHWLSAIALTLLYLVMYISYAFRRFDEGILVQPLYPVLALFLTAAGTILYRYFFEERPRTFWEHLFRRQVAPEAVDQVLSTLQDGSLQLKGVRRLASVLYVDLREFSALAETLTAERTIQLLNGYVTRIVGAIFRYAGSVTMHSSDTIIAVWNLPLDQIDHARRAVCAALDIKHEIDELCKSLPKEEQIQIGIGIGTGKVTAGNVGTSAHAEYTILGETIAMTERIAMKPERGVYIDATTRDMIGDEFDTREVNPVRLRRRTDPILVWKVYSPDEFEEETTNEETREETTVYKPTGASGFDIPGNGSP